jgi:hypothetical protein
MELMNIVQQIRCKKDFIEWCKKKNRAALKHPDYGKRVFAIFQKAWMKK